MILIVKVTLDNIFHILPLFQLKNPNLLHINYEESEKRKVETGYYVFYTKP